MEFLPAKWEVIKPQPVLASEHRSILAHAGTHQQGQKIDRCLTHPVLFASSTIRSCTRHGSSTIDMAQFAGTLRASPPTLPDGQAP